MSETNDVQLRITIDEQLAADATKAFARFGLNPAIVITALYKRVAKEGSIPFAFNLSDEEAAEIELANNVAHYDAPIIYGKDAVQAYLIGDNDTN